MRLTVHGLERRQPREQILLHEQGKKSKHRLDRRVKAPVLLVA